VSNPAQDMDGQSPRDNLEHQPVAEVVGQPANFTKTETEIKYEVIGDDDDEDPKEVIVEIDSEEPNESDAIKTAKKQWKLDNPSETLKEQRRLLLLGKIDHLPWLDYVDNNQNDIKFGLKFPTDPVKGQQFIKIDVFPTKLFKFNGDKWIEIDKDLNDRYTHSQDYINFLISKISTGEYDLDLLSEAEKIQIEINLKQGQT
jgi:hypothetical protein